eukprot:2878522-Pleurochrysis_carterae.AAC.1
MRQVAPLPLRVILARPNQAVVPARKRVGAQKLVGIAKRRRAPLGLCQPANVEPDLTVGNVLADLWRLGPSRPPFIREDTYLSLGVVLAHAVLSRRRGGVGGVAARRVFAPRVCRVAPLGG